MEKKNKQKITQFSTGAKRDLQQDKENYPECISWLALRRYALYMKKASAKYGENNWRKGIPIESYEKSLLRHMQKYFANKYDGANLEPNIDHLAAAMFNLQGLMHEQEKKTTLVNTIMNLWDFLNKREPIIYPPSDIERIKKKLKKKQKKNK